MEGCSKVIHIGTLNGLLHEEVMCHEFNTTVKLSGDLAFWYTCNCGWQVLHYALNVREPTSDFDGSMPKGTTQVDPESGRLEEGEIELSAQVVCLEPRFCVPITHGRNEVGRFLRVGIPGGKACLVAAVRKGPCLVVPE